VAAFEGLPGEFPPGAARGGQNGQLHGGDVLPLRVG
jgi:hypothetical protein